MTCIQFVRKKLNSKGSASIEFIAMVPFVLLLMVMLWQFLIGAYALITANRQRMKLRRCMLQQKMYRKQQQPAKKSSMQQETAFDSILLDRSFQVKRMGILISLLI